MPDDSDDDLLLDFHLKRSRAAMTSSGRRGKEGLLKKDSLHRASSQVMPKNREGNEDGGEDNDDDEEVDGDDDDDKPLSVSFLSKKSSKKAAERLSGKCFVKSNNQDSTNTVTTVEQRKVTLKVYNKKEVNSGNCQKNGSTDSVRNGVVDDDDEMPLIHMPKNTKKKKQPCHVSGGSRSAIVDDDDDDMPLMHISNNIKKRKQSSEVSSTKHVKVHVNSLNMSTEEQRLARIAADSKEEYEEEEKEPKINVEPSRSSIERNAVPLRAANSEDSQHEKEEEESKAHANSSNVDLESTVSLVAADSEVDEEEETEEKDPKMRVNSSNEAIERQRIAIVVADSENKQEENEGEENEDKDAIADVQEIEKGKLEVAAEEEEEEEGEEESHEEEEVELGKEEKEEDIDKKIGENLKKELAVISNANNNESDEDEYNIPLRQAHVNGKKKNRGNILIVDDHRSMETTSLQNLKVSFAQSIKLVDEEEEDDDDEDIPLAKMLCLKSKKSVSTKQKVSVVVNVVKEENVVDDNDDYDIPLSRQFAFKRKKHTGDGAIQKLKQAGIKKEKRDDDDDIPLGKMLCLNKDKAAVSKASATFFVPPKSEAKTYTDNIDEDDSEGYNELIVKKTFFKKKTSTVKRLVSERKVPDSQKKKLKTPSKWRDSDSDEEDSGDDNDLLLVQTISSEKKNYVDRKAKFNAEKRKPKTPSKDEDSDEEDDEWEEDEGDDDEDEDYDASVVKKSRIVSKSKTNTKKDAKLRMKKKAKKMKDIMESGGGQKWTTLEHNGVIFPPPYQPHGVKMLYNGRPVDLTSEQEEVATMFAVMHDTDYAAKAKFVENFWNDWKNILGENHVIQGLEGCDFTPIYNWYIGEKEKKKQMTTEEKKAAKEEKMKQEENYMWALVDGVKEKVGNFRVEPPGLFRGRGEHPKMGKVKRRICPEEIVINIGAEAPIPECPIPGRRWKEIRHDNTVTWLAYWNDPINSKEQKYVFLAASSNLKGQSDKEKYEKARLLKDYIDDIRRTYTANFTSSNPTTRQIAVATYLIDRLALRAGNEKDDDEADTVGCCSLKVEHVALFPPTSLEFDFLGKDSIRYYNKVEVIEPVYNAIGDFKKDKVNGEDLFDKLDTNKLNTHLKNIMPQLTAKVFRTYNASITLDTLLMDTDGQLIPEKIASYQKANKEVAILCNHQRSVSKTHGAQMEKLEGKLAELTELLDELEKELKMAQKGKSVKKDADGNSKRNPNPEMLERKILQTRHKIERMKLDMMIKEDLKTVALGTSKINYMDPRITVAWCKQHEVPIEKVFNKSLLAKFAWAMEVDMSFRF